MLKEHADSISILQRLVDVTIVLLSWMACYYIRFNTFLPSEVGNPFLYLKLSAFLMVITLFVFNRNGLYKSLRFTSRYEEIGTVLRSHTSASFFFILILFFFFREQVSRIALISYWFIGALSLVTFRILIRNFLRTLRKQGKNLRFITLVGNGPQMHDYLASLKKYKDSGLRIKNWIDSAGMAKEYQIEEVPLSEDINQIVEKNRSDGIVIGYPNNQISRVEEVLKEIHDEIVPIFILPDLRFSYLGHSISDFAGTPILSMNQPNFSGTELALKRLFDFLASFFGLILISPLLALIAVLTKLSSRGPIFYPQVRMSLDGKEFKMWKFRSMKVLPKGTKIEPGWTVEDDPRRTAFGSLLRKTSLDELPQLWNVLIGQMSLVGPRPEQPFFVDKFKKEIPAYMLRHKMKAGITGWAQVNGWRGDTSIKSRIDCDLYYIRNWSFWFDIRILIMTFIRGFINKNAY